MTSIIYRNIKKREQYNSTDMSKIIKSIESTNKRAVVTLNTMDTSIPNAIRRTLLSHIPTYSIDVDSIDIKDNTTIFHNERISHILSHIPVKNGVNKYKYDDVTFSITGIYNAEKKLPTFEEKIMVYSDDIKSSDGNSYFCPMMPIIEIRKDEKLIVTSFKLKKDVQYTHAQFQACIPTYKVTKNTKDNVTVELGITPCGMDKKGTPYPHKPIKALLIAVNTIKEKLKSLKQRIEDDEVIIEAKEICLATILINDENDTVGFLLQSEILNMTNNKDFCGYRNVHPLKHQLMIKLVNPQPKKLLLQALTNLYKTFGDIELTIKKYK